jgi:large subunit ribosomal protein L13
LLLEIGCINILENMQGLGLSGRLNACNIPPLCRGRLVDLAVTYILKTRYTGLVMKTISAKADDVKRDWFLVDADGKTLGRLATEIARRLRGKHKAIYTPHVDTGDYIVVINAEKVRVSGNKASDKMYYRHSGYMGGLKETSFNDMIKRSPERVIEIAVKGMLPRNPLGRAMYRKLKVYAGAEHQHTAQQPQPLEIN